MHASPLNAPEKNDSQKVISDCWLRRSSKYLHVSNVVKNAILCDLLKCTCILRDVSQNCSHLSFEKAANAFLSVERSNALHHGAVLFWQVLKLHLDV